MKIARLSHYGSRVVRAVPTTDGRIHAPTAVSDAELDQRVAQLVDKRTRDSMLNAVGTGKVLALGRVWSGELQPEIDSRLDALRPLATGYTIGNRLTAEPAAPSLDLGRRWVGDIRDIIRSGARDSEDGQGERVDLTDLARSAERLEDAFEKNNPDLIRSAHDQLRRDFDEVRRKHADGARRTADAAFADRGAWEAAAMSATIRGMNQANRNFWNAHSYNGTGAPMPAAAATPRPARTRDWAMDIPGGSPFVNRRSLTFGGANPPSVADINRANAAFWAARDGNGPQNAA
ncbi:MAG: hypothetical protein M0038_09155 [Pseudomonadota bacterium]|nr:hypothetical protein [Pseudomonadota bacterium]